MAGANVGNLNVKLTLSAEQFAAALMAAGGDVNAFAMKVEAGKSNLKGMDAAAASTATNVKALTTEMKNYSQYAGVALRNVSDSGRLFQLPRRGTDELIAAGNAQRAALAGTSAEAGKLGGRLQSLAPVITAISFGAQDAASQLGNRGFGAALQAAANNIPMLGIPWGGVGVAVASGISVAVQALGSYIEYTERAAKATKEVKDASAAAYGQRLDTIQSAAVGSNQFTRSLLDAAAGGTASLRSMQSDRRNTITDVRSALDALAPEREGAAAAFARANDAIRRRANALYQGDEKLAATDVGPGFNGPALAGLRDAAAKQVADISAREQKLKDAGNTALRELERINEAIPQAAAEEAARQRKIDEEAARRFRAADAEETTRRMKAAASIAPGVGATEAGSAGQFSQIQAALRAGQDRDLAAQKQIQSNTSKTATNTREIARKVGRIKAVSIA